MMFFLPSLIGSLFRLPIKNQPPVYFIIPQSTGFLQTFFQRFSKTGSDGSYVYKCVSSSKTPNKTEKLILDSDNRIVFKSLPVGKYTLTAYSAPTGFAKISSQTITVTAGETKAVTVVCQG
jgi:hypothetical protein